MELFFLLMLVALMAGALASGYPVAFALPGSAIITIGCAALAGYFFAAGDTGAYFAQGDPIQWLNAGVTNFRGVYWEVERDTLIAIPLFIFMGIMLQRSRIAEDLLVTMAQLFGPLPGGLGISVVVVGALLAATTGIVGATVVAMGLISLPAMLRNNYSHSLATGTIAASGTLGQIIPPSIVLIILADQLASAVDQASTARKLLYKDSTGSLTMPSEFDVISTSAGEMFLGAFVPGILLVLLYVVFIFVWAMFNPKSAPAVAYDGKYDMQFAGKVILTLVPPLALILIVLGSIIMGIATVNQAGAIGAIGALIMAGYRLVEDQKGAYIPAILALSALAVVLYITQNNPLNIKRLSDADMPYFYAAVISVSVFIFALLWSGWRVLKVENTLRGVMIETSKATSLVFIILLGAAMLTSAFRGFGGEELVKEFLTGLPGGFWAQFFIVMMVIFVLGFFLDFIEIAVVVVPIVAPILLADPGANVTAVWLGVMIGLNIQTSFLTPPFGFALFYLRGVAPRIVKTVSMYKGVIAFILLQLVGLTVVAFNPKLVNYLPQRLSLTSETAPPPINPKLQYCVEQLIGREFAENGTRIKTAIAEARNIQLKGVPSKLARSFKESLDDASAVFPALAAVQASEQAILGAAPEYRPMHSQVRRIQSDIRDVSDEIKREETLLSRLRGDTEAISTRRKYLEDEIAGLKAQQEARRKEIPGAWKDKRDEFAKLLKARSDARRKFRRMADGSYEPVAELRSVMEAGALLAAQKEPVAGLAKMIAEADLPKAADAIRDVRAAVRSVPGTRAVASALAKARRAVRGRKPDREKARAELEKAITALDKDIAWRKASQENGDLGLVVAYDEAIRNTIGLRKQPRLTREAALQVADCSAAHRDISLNF